MSVIISNDFKNRFLRGEVMHNDDWKFIPVNADFKNKFEHDDVKIEHYTSKDELDTYANGESYEMKGDVITYTWSKVEDDDDFSNRPMYITEDNYEAFKQQYNKVIKDNTNIDNYIKAGGFYAIRSKDELSWFADRVNDKNGNNKIIGVLCDPIEGVIDNIIGKSEDCPFEGILDGNGFKINNITIDCTECDNGIVGVLGKNGIVRNFFIGNVLKLQCNKKINIRHLTTDGRDVNCGILVGRNYGTIENIDTVARVGNKLTLNGFVPEVYSVTNKSDSYNDFTEVRDKWSNDEENFYFLNSWCINSPGNINPYVGYFAEGIYAERATMMTKTGVEMSPVFAGCVYNGEDYPDCFPSFTNSAALPNALQNTNFNSDASLRFKEADFSFSETANNTADGYNYGAIHFNCLYDNSGNCYNDLNYIKNRCGNDAYKFFTGLEISKQQQYTAQMLIKKFEDKDKNSVDIWMKINGDYAITNDDENYVDFTSGLSEWYVCDFDECKLKLKKDNKIEFYYIDYDGEIRQYDICKNLHDYYTMNCSEILGLTELPGVFAVGTEGVANGNKKPFMRNIYTAYFGASSLIVNNRFLYGFDEGDTGESNKTSIFLLNGGNNTGIYTDSNGVYGSCIRTINPNKIKKLFDDKKINGNQKTYLANLYKKFEYIKEHLYGNIDSSETYVYVDDRNNTVNIDVNVIAEWFTKTPTTEVWDYNDTKYKSDDMHIWFNEHPNVRLNDYDYLHMIQAALLMSIEAQNNSANITNVTVDNKQLINVTDQLALVHHQINPDYFKEDTDLQWTCNDPNDYNFYHHSKLCHIDFELNTEMASTTHENKDDDGNENKDVVANSLCYNTELCYNDTYSIKNTILQYFKQINNINDQRINENGVWFVIKGNDKEETYNTFKSFFTGTAAVNEIDVSTNTTILPDIVYLQYNGFKSTRNGTAMYGRGKFYSKFFNLYDFRYVSPRQLIYMHNQLDKNKPGILYNQHTIGKNISLGGDNLSHTKNYYDTLTNSHEFYEIDANGIFTTDMNACLYSKTEESTINDLYDPRTCIINYNNNIQMRSLSAIDDSDSTDWDYFEDYLGGEGADAYFDDNGWPIYCTDENRNGGNDKSNFSRFKFSIPSTLLNRAIRMHDSERAAYYVSPIAGSNYGQIKNIRLSEICLANETNFVGFIGGLAGKQERGLISGCNVELNDKNLTYSGISRDEYWSVRYDNDTIFPQKIKTHVRSYLDNATQNSAINGIVNTLFGEKNATYNISSTNQNINTYYLKPVFNIGGLFGRLVPTNATVHQNESDTLNRTEIKRTDIYYVHTPLKNSINYNTEQFGLDNTFSAKTTTNEQLNGEDIHNNFGTIAGLIELETNNFGNDSVSSNSAVGVIIDELNMQDVENKIYPFGRFNYIPNEMNTIPTTNNSPREKSNDWIGPTQYVTWTNDYPIITNARRSDLNNTTTRSTNKNHGGLINQSPDAIIATNDFTKNCGSLEQKSIMKNSLYKNSLTTTLRDSLKYVVSANNVTGKVTATTRTHIGISQNDISAAYKNVINSASITSINYTPAFAMLQDADDSSVYRLNPNFGSYVNFTRTGLPETINYIGPTKIFDALSIETKDNVFAKNNKTQCITKSYFKFTGAMSIKGGNKNSKDEYFYYTYSAKSETQKTFSSTKTVNFTVASANGSATMGYVFSDNTSYSGDGFVYQNNYIHLGDSVSDKQIKTKLNELAKEDIKTFNTSGVSADSKGFGGVLVTDSNDKIVMFIDNTEGIELTGNSWNFETLPVKVLQSRNTTVNKGMLIEVK